MGLSSAHLAAVVLAWFLAIELGPTAAVAEHLPGATQEQFLALFLTPEDLPGMKMRGDFRAPQPLEDFAAESRAAIAAQRAGNHYGRANWRIQDEAVGISHDVEDYVWRFPTVDEAKKYYAENSASLAAPEQPVPNQPKIGDESIMTGGQAGSGDFVIRGYVVVSRVGNVVFKLNTVDTNPTTKLSPLTLTSVAQKAVARIKAAGVQ